MEKIAEQNKRREAGRTRPARKRAGEPSTGTSSDREDGSRRRLRSVQHLRLLAAVFVLYGHIIHEATARFTGGQGAFDPPPILDWGIGVNVFFVISGFVMGFTHRTTGFGDLRGAATFLRRRAERIVPLYWIFTTLMLVAVLAVPEAIDFSTMDPAYVASSYLFLPWPRSDAEVRPVLALGWTLNYEMFFYVLFAASLLLPRRWRFRALAAVLVGAVAVHTVVPQSWWLLHFWTDPIVLDFLVGVGLAKLYRLNRRFSLLEALAGAAAALMIAMIFLRIGYSDTLLGANLPAVLLAAAWILGPGFIRSRRLSRALSFGGDASYALYLSHPFALNAVSLAWEKFGLAEPWLFVGVSFAGALAGAVFVHVALERPLMTWLHRDSRPLSPVPQPDPITVSENGPDGRK